MEKVVVRRSELHGRGCFATDTIRKGEIVGRMQVQPVEKNGSHVIWVDDEAFRVTCGLRFINHDDNPNTFVDDHLVVRATRLIKAGEELTFYYGDDYFD